MCCVCESAKLTPNRFLLALQFCNQSVGRLVRVSLWASHSSDISVSSTLSQWIVFRCEHALLVCYRNLALNAFRPCVCTTLCVSVLISSVSVVQSKTPHSLIHSSHISKIVSFVRWIFCMLASARTSRFLFPRNCFDTPNTTLNRISCQQCHATI